MAGFKELLEKKERAQARAAAFKAEAQVLEKEIRKQQAQLQKSARAAIGGVVLRAITEGWVTVDVEKLRTEAIASLPPRRIDVAETIADLIEVAHSAAVKQADIAGPSPKPLSTSPAAAAEPEKLVASTAEAPAARDAIDDLLDDLLPLGARLQVEPAKPDVDIAHASVDKPKEDASPPGGGAHAVCDPKPGVVATTPPSAATGFRRPIGRPGVPASRELKPSC